jgi:hypothetical protein
MKNHAKQNRRADRRAQRLAEVGGGWFITGPTIVVGGGPWVVGGPASAGWSVGGAPVVQSGGSGWVVGRAPVASGGSWVISSED